MVRGWDPDTTFWLTDVARESDGHRRTWHRASPGDPWTQVP